LNAAYCDATVTVNQRPTTLVYTGDTKGQYSDCAKVSAKLTDTVSGTPIQGKTVTFTLQTAAGGTTLSGSVSATTDASGVAMTTCTMVDPVGTNAYKVCDAVCRNCPYLACSASPVVFTITPEDTAPLTVAGYYTGDVFFWTTGPNSSSASLTLSATVKDISDSCLGDIPHRQGHFCHPQRGR